MTATLTLVGAVLLHEPQRGQLVAIADDLAILGAGTQARRHLKAGRHAVSDVAFADLTLAHIEAARERVKGAALRTPLVRRHVSLDYDGAPREIWRKLETSADAAAVRVLAVEVGPARAPAPEARTSACHGL